MPLLAPAPPRPAARTVRAVAAALLARYGPWRDEDLPVIDQLVWFLLSTRTTVENCESAYRALRAAYPGWDALAAAPEEALHSPLRPAGLFRSRARNLLAALGAIRARFGEVDLEALRSWESADCEAFLLSLPGVGLKVARCVLSFGLGRKAFAVDAHIWRVSRRLGWHDFPGEAPTRRGADGLQSLLPAGIDSLSLHVNLIRLGREFCLAGEPRCAPCPLGRRCLSARRGQPGARAEAPL